MGHRKYLYSYFFILLWMHSLMTEMDGHAVMFVDEVSMELISGTRQLQSGHAQVLVQNPFRSHLFIRTHESRIHHAEVFSITGWLLFKHHGTPDTMLDIDLQHHLPGIYILKLALENGISITKRIFKME